MAARGWAWTAYDWDEGRLFNYIGDAQNTFPIWNATPLVALDVYEHAYFLDYRTDRARYIDAFFDNLDWAVVNELGRRGTGFRRRRDSRTRAYRRRLAARLDSVRLLARAGVPATRTSAAGSGNIGATNVWRTYGRGTGCRSCCLDVAKGFVPALVGTHARVAAGGRRSRARAAMSGTGGRSSSASRAAARWSRPAAARYFGVAPLVARGRGCRLARDLLGLRLRVGRLDLAGDRAAAVARRCSDEPWPVVVFGSRPRSAVIAPPPREHRPPAPRGPRTGSSSGAAPRAGRQERDGTGARRRRALRRRRLADGARARRPPRPGAAPASPPATGPTRTGARMGSSTPTRPTASTRSPVPPTRSSPTRSASTRGGGARMPARTPRFDLAEFPGCDGLAALDIGVLRLSASAASVAPAADRYRTITRDVPAPGEWKKTVVYYDGPVDEPTLCGEGTGLPTSGLLSVAVVYLRSTCTRSQALRAAVTAHELTHALGAPSGRQPHPCGNDRGHVCDSDHDLMYPALVVESLDELTLDVGHDDYYRNGGRSAFDVSTSAWLRHLDAPQQTLRSASRPAASSGATQPGLVCSATCTSAWDAGSALVALGRSRRRGGASSAGRGRAPAPPAT